MKTYKTLFVGLLLMTTGLINAQNKKIEVELWPNGAPNSNGLSGPEFMAAPNRPTNITHPTLTVYPSAKPNSKTIIMCPGGGYIREAIDIEGHDMAAWMNSIGVTYIVLKYRLPNKHCEVPLSDLREAICQTRQHAAKWNVDPDKVGVMGASAGGNLAATGATLLQDKEIRPDFQILLYPVITMDSTYTHKGSRYNLLGKNPSDEQIKHYSADQQVTDQTPPAFIVLCNDDHAVPPLNGISYYLALLKHHVSATLHVYPTGGHGFGFRDSFIYKKQWTEELEKWLNVVVDKLPK